MYYFLLLTAAEIPRGVRRSCFIFSVFKQPRLCYNYTYRRHSLFQLRIFALGKIYSVKLLNEMNTPNYDKLFCEYIEKLDGKSLPKLLLHVCCAPCATQCLTKLLPYFDVTLYYCNDNITVDGEWEKRLAEVEKLAGIINCGSFEANAAAPVKLAVKQLDANVFFAASKGLEREKEGGLRCRECFAMRLGDSINFAKENGFDLAATTLTVSPYKNSRLLNEIGLSLADKCGGIEWLPSDFKKHNGYAESVRLSQKYGLYRQHFCGCAFSFAELAEKQR